MAINKDSNGYVIGFSIVMVVVVGTLLAAVSMALKPAQLANVRNEKMQNIIQATGMEVDRDKASESFKEIVVKRVLLDYYGNIIEGSEMTGEDEIIDGNVTDPFNIDLLKEYKTIKDPKERNYPLFVCKVDGEIFYVAPVQGQGLWAAIWGYVSLKGDGATVKGAVFDHKSETPGLGAEISLSRFEDQFKDKTIAENGNYTSVEVIKPGPALTDHSVNGISGGTFTSVGVDEMIRRTMIVYYNFINDNPEFGK